MAVAVLAALLMAFVLFALLGYDIQRTFSTVLFTSFRTKTGFADTLEKLVPVLLLAYAFALPMAAGRSNIGGEGQLVMGAVGATAAGILLASLPGVVLLPIVILAGVASGAIWGGIAGWLLYRLGVNEILSTVLLNFVSLGLSNYVATEIWPDPTAGHPTTVAISRSACLPLLCVRPPLSAGLFLALLAALWATVWVRRTVGGYELVATGANPRAARVFGIDDRKMSLLALVLAGALGGLAGAIDVAGVHHRLIEGLQSNYLVLGILVGLMTRGNLVAVPPVAFLVCVMEVGASALQRRLMVPVEMVLIIEASILIFVLMSEKLGRR